MVTGARCVALCSVTAAFKLCSDWRVLLISLIQALIPQWFHFPLDDNSREALQLAAELGAEEMLQNHLSPRKLFCLLA